MALMRSLFSRIVLWPVRVIKRFKDRITGYILRKRIRNKKRMNIRIVFLVAYPQLWNSFKTVYEKLRQDDNLDVILLAWVGNADNSDDEMFWKSIDNKVIISKKKNIFPLHPLKADIIFRQTPYDSAYPKEYSARVMCGLAKLCYIPYGYEPSPLKHLRIEYNDSFFPFVYAIFCDNHSTKEFCEKKARKSFFMKDILCLDYGFPRFDISKLATTRKEYNCFMWIPRWSLDPHGNDATGFFAYYEKLMYFFKRHVDLSLIIRPHPLMFRNFTANGVMTQNDIKKIRQTIRKTNNIFLDESADYLDSFNLSDVLIADWSSLTIEYFMTCKPLVYCGDKGEFNKETQCMMQLFYTVHDWDELENRLNLLIKGFDPNLEERLKLVSSIKGNEHGENATIRIVRACKSEF